MPKDTKEPQSYGSGPDWLTGRTGQQVNDPESAPPAGQREFYDDRRESETSAPDQGGRTSEVQMGESDQPDGKPSVEESPRITTEEGGAKRDSFFKKRDYD